MSVAARYRYTLVAGATAVVIGTGFTAVGLSKHSDAATTTTGSRVADSAPLATGATPPAVDEILLGDGASPSATATPSAPVPTSAAPKASPSAAKKTAARHTPRPTRSPSKTATPTKAPDVPQTGGTILDQVLAHINAARTAEGLSTLTLSADLSKASALHNQLMINGCGLSHQCAGEDGIGPRFSAQGVNWTSAGENIGFGSSGASDADLIKAANGLTDSMLAEVAPNDGHRKNLLSKDFKRIGLSVVRDSKGITWMTQDFVN